jgi:haloacetate dehalogenase
MIGADPRAYWLKKCGSGSAGVEPFTPEALEAYLTAFEAPGAIVASCEDYRAAATIDVMHDDQDQGRLVTCPILVLWGDNGVIQAHFDCLGLWRERATHVEGQAIPGGHYLAEERPAEIVSRTLDFLLQESN